MNAAWRCMHRDLRALVARLALVALAGLLLSGCASKVLIDGDVTSTSRLVASADKPTFRFERQISLSDTQQKELEAWADAALLRAGLQRDDARPQLSVQLLARLQPVVTYAGSARSGVWVTPWHGAPPYGLRSHGLRPFGSMRPLETVWYQYEVMVTMRDLSSSQVVYETRAAAEQPWNRPASIFPVLFDMALQGFPVPPAGPRRLRTEIELP